MSSFCGEESEAATTSTNHSVIARQPAKEAAIKPLATGVLTDS